MHNMDRRQAVTRARDRVTGRERIAQAIQDGLDDLEMEAREELKRLANMAAV